MLERYRYLGRIVRNLGSLIWVFFSYVFILFLFLFYAGRALVELGGTLISCYIFNICGYY